ncbi:MAG: hypothetical protein ACOX9C_07775 [Kiritimatiellia bacterium]|jgi:hypothetical protein
MKPTPILAASLCAAFCLGAILLHSGCESADDYGIEISQTSHEVTAVGQTVGLTASGWSDYLWTLENSSYGRLNRTTGATVVYTVTSMPTNSSVEVTINVKGMGTGATSASNTSSTVTGSTTIKHTVAKPKTTTNSKPKPKITVDPDFKEVTAVGEVVDLKATGGTDYVWTLDPPEGWGRLRRTPGKSASATYIVEQLPTNAPSKRVIITVSDPNSTDTKAGTSEIRHVKP